MTTSSPQEAAAENRQQHQQKGSQRQGALRGLLTSPVALMALTIFIDFTGFGLILPLLPFWAEHFGADARAIGLLITVYALAQLLFTPVLGGLSDRYGRRPIIITSLLIEVVGFALTALAGTLPLLLVARFVGGLGASNMGSAQAVVADVTSRVGRAKAMGAIGAAIGFGFVVGPALGGALSAWGTAAPFWVAAALAVVNALLVWRFLPETRGRRATAGAATSSAASSTAPMRKRLTLVAGWGNLARNPAIARLVTINLLYTLAFAGMESVFALLTQRQLGWGAVQNGYLFTYIGVIVVVMQGGLVGLLVKRFGERSLLVAGLMLLGVGLALLPFGANLVILLIGVSVLSLGDGAVTPTISTLLSFASADEAQGATLGLAQGLSSLGRMLGPLLAGVLFVIGAGLPFIAGAALAALAVGLALPALPGAQDHSAPAPGGASPPAASTDATTTPNAGSLLLAAAPVRDVHSSRPGASQRQGEQHQERTPSGVA
ncbi:MAG: MFS transporter [Ktedonobacterales bacterium]